MEPYRLQFGKPSQGVGEERGSWIEGVSGEDRLAVEAYLALSPERRHAVRELIHLLGKPAEKHKR